MGSHEVAIGEPTGRAAFLHLHGFSSTEICEEKENKHWVHGWLRDPAAAIEQIQKNGITQPRWPHTLYGHVFRGWYPETDCLPVDLIPTFYNSYVSTYIDRDIRLMAGIDDLSQFHRFFRLICTALMQVSKPTYHRAKSSK